VKRFQPCLPSTFFHPENKGEISFSQSENKKNPDTKNIKKETRKKKQEKEKRKNLLDSKWSSKLLHPCQNRQ
jgi:hypothetical protein